MLFVAIAVALLGLLLVVGFVVLLAKLGSLADELRDARQRDAADHAARLGDLASKLQSALTQQGALVRSVDELGTELRGPSSMRRPPITTGA